jgi:hypothetical protein
MQVRKCKEFVAAVGEEKVIFLPQSCPFYSTEKNYNRIFHDEMILKTCSDTTSEPRAYASSSSSVSPQTGQTFSNLPYMYMTNILWFKKQLELRQG